ncbi:MAG: hypothetical protein WBX01_04040 [Nitrososphaeraceae archaeon]
MTSGRTPGLISSAAHFQSRRTHEYDILEKGSDVLIVHSRKKIDWQVEGKFGGREQLDSLVYRMVSTIVRTSQEQRSGLKELARDEAYTNIVEEVYTQLEQGRSVLQRLRH